MCRFVTFYCSIWIDLMHFDSIMPLDRACQIPPPRPWITCRVTSCPCRSAMAQPVALRECLGNCGTKTHARFLHPPVTPSHVFPCLELWNKNFFWSLAIYACSHMHRFSTASHKVRHDKSWTSVAKLCVFGLLPGTSKTTESAFCLFGGKITSPAPGSFLVLIEFDFMRAIHILGISWPWPKSVALIHSHIPFHSILMPFPLLRLYFSSMSWMSHVIIVIKVWYVLNSYYDMFGVSPAFSGLIASASWPVDWFNQELQSLYMQNIALQQHCERYEEYEHIASRCIHIFSTYSWIFLEMIHVLAFGQRFLTLIQFDDTPTSWRLTGLLDCR